MVKGLSGGCLCGAVRYRLSRLPDEAGYCHCRMCQRASGSPVMAFGTVPLGALDLTSAALRKRRSSDIAERWFCSECGTPIAIHADYQLDTVDIALATFDHPEVVVPGFHIWTDRRIAWFDTVDDCPRYAAFRPETRGEPGEATAIDAKDQR